MNSIKFDIFSVIIGFILVSADLIFLYHWKKFVREIKWSRWFYIIPIILSAIIFCVLLYFVYKNLTHFLYEKADKILYFIVIFWYIPKLIIVPALLTIKLIAYISSKIKIIFTNKNNEEINTIKNSQIKDGRRKLLKTIGWTAAGLPFIAVVDGYARVTYDFKVYKTDIFLQKLPRQFDGIRIVQLSDIHAGSFYSSKPPQHAFEIANELKPDIIFITGDFVNHNPLELKLIYDNMKKLNAELGVFGSLGNHDHWMPLIDHKVLIEALQNAGIKMLINNNKIFKIDGAKLQLASIDNISHRQSFGDFSKALSGLHADSPIILLAHDPMIWDKAVRRKLKIDLQLSGHTHGGQIVLDFFGEKIAASRIFYKEWEGLYKDGEQYLYINRGIGTVGPPIRVGVYPEISLITLIKKS